MKQRQSKPKNSKYYMRIVDGGLNGAVQGSPVDRTATVLSNCVGYANGRFNEIINDPELKGLYKPFKYQLVCNAENFIERARQQGLVISPTPTLGGIMVWQKGATLNSYDGAGHVAIVEEILNSNKIITSESGWQVYAFKRFTRTNQDGRWDMGGAFTFRGCIVNPSVLLNEKDVKKYYEVTSYRNCYSDVYKSERIMQVPEGSRIYVSKRYNKWLYIDALKGWIYESDSKLGMCVKQIKTEAKLGKTTRSCPARSLPVRGSKVNQQLEKGRSVKGRDLISGYRYAIDLGWVTDKWIK